MDSPVERRGHGECSETCSGSTQGIIRRIWTRTRRSSSCWRSGMRFSASTCHTVGYIVWLLFLVTMVHGLHPNTLNLFSSRRVGRVSSSTHRRMVLTTPESIIEQASTTTLLDDLIDESVRTSARRPIMRQFDPSSGWIWKRWKGTIFSETWDDCVSFSIFPVRSLFG
jgi:hypothetical protein